MKNVPMIRLAKAEDMPELTFLWQQAFGDEEPFIRGFYSLLPGMGFALVAVHENRVVAAAHVITGMDYIDSTGHAHPAAYLYAVSVREDLRGAGIGGILVEAAAKEALRRGAEMITTSPAEESLYPWYAQRIGTVFTLSRTSHSALPGPMLSCTPISAKEYACRREQLLSGRPHLRVSDAVMQLQELLCKCCSGGLYAVPGGLFTASVFGGEKAVLSECIGPDPQQIAASAASLFHVQAAEYCTAGTGSPFLSSTEPIAELTEWNLIFD